MTADKYEVKISNNTRWFLEQEWMEIEELIPFSQRLAVAVFPRNENSTFYVDLRRPFNKMVVWEKSRTFTYVMIPVLFNKKWCKLWVKDISQFYRTFIADCLELGRNVFTIEVNNQYDWRIIDNPKDINLKDYWPSYFP